uniref:Uncharacterized protein n=1 Tax=Serinus canaria TaxID=9135 RepID=A0A8C9MKQ0_SERCA
KCWYLPRAQCCQPRAQWYLPRAQCCLPRAQCCLPRAQCCLPRAQCCLPRARCCLPRSQCCLPRAQWYLQAQQLWPHGHEGSGTSAGMVRRGVSGQWHPELAGAHITQLARLPSSP